MTDNTFLLDGEEIPFQPGQTVIQAALAAGGYIPHLCYHPEFKPHGSCKVCTVKVNGRTAASCTLPAQAGLEVESDTDEINDLRRTLVQMLFAEGNHFCPSCEKSGNCTLQALGYDLGVMTAGFRHFFPDRPVDASHPDILLDFNRCILCELCVRASCEVEPVLPTRRLTVNHAEPPAASEEFSNQVRKASICASVKIQLTCTRSMRAKVTRRARAAPDSMSLRRLWSPGESW